MTTITNIETGDVFETIGTEVVGDNTKIFTIINERLFVITVPNEEFAKNYK